MVPQCDRGLCYFHHTTKKPVKPIAHFLSILEYYNSITIDARLPIEKIYFRFDLKKKKKTQDVFTYLPKKKSPKEDTLRSTPEISLLDIQQRNVTLSTNICQDDKVSIVDDLIVCRLSIFGGSRK